MNDGWKNFLSFFKQFGVKQTRREHDKEKFVKHIGKTVLKSGKRVSNIKQEEYHSKNCNEQEN